jgi:predicted small secreted protein
VLKAIMGNNKTLSRYHGQGPWVPQKKEGGMKKLALLGLIGAILMISFLGCNALRGAGKDVSDSGEHIQNVGK